MALRKPNKKPFEVPNKNNIYGPYNDSDPMNYSHKENEPHNFNLRQITLEDIDQAVFSEFNERFYVNGSLMKLYNGDAETTSLPMMNYENYDQAKQFLSWPFFIYTRTDTKKVYRSNPVNKRITYAIPKKKAQGIVIEEYITAGPINYELTYQFKFVSYYRASCNEIEQQLNHYFRNKRNMILLGNERFSIGPADGNNVSTLEMVDRDSPGSITMYVLNFNLKLYCWTMDLSDMQKRERPNSVTMNMVIKDDNAENNEAEVERFVVENQTKPNEIIDLE